jgi:hypothetical protein
VAHFASSSAGLSLRTAISTTAGAAQVLAVYNHRLAQADLVMLAASGTRSACPAAAVAFALASAGITRGFLAQTTSRSSGQLCMLDQNRRKSCSNGRKKLGKQLTGW